MSMTIMSRPDRELSRQRALADLGAFALTCDDRQTLLEVAAHQAAQALAATHSMIGRYRAGQVDFLAVAGRGWAPGILDRTVLTAHPDGPAGRASLSGQPVLFADLTLEQHHPDRALFAAHGLRCIAATPIRSDGDAVGVLLVAGPHPHQFDATDLDLLDALSTLTGAAIHRLEVEAERDALLGELRDSEQRYRQMTELIPHIVWTADPDGRVDYYNRRWTDYTGLRVTDAVRGEWPDCLHPDDSDRTAAAWAQAVNTGCAYEIEHRIRRSDGGWRWMLSRGWPMYDRHGRIVKWFGTATDIDAEKQVQLALGAARDAAERANRSKTRFLAAASHDLRQPLNAISLLLGTLRGRTAEPEARDIIRQIEGSLDGMIDLFETLLDLSKLESGVVELDIRPVCLSTMLSRIAQDFSPQTRAKGLRLRIRSSGAFCLTDATLLERIVRNLVANAVRYTDRGGILIAVRHRGGGLRLDVIDSGRGIPDERLEEIFLEFQQLQNEARERSGGHGLGLAIVRRAAQSLGHRIEVRSRLGHGSRFSVELPLSSAPAAAGSGPPQTPTGAIPQRGASVLLLEDDPLIQVATRMLLEDQGYRVLVAQTAAAALSSLPGANSPDLILADYRLPGGTDGLTAIEQIRAALERSLPATLITGDVTEDVEKKARALGVHFLRKPVKPSDLLAVLDACRPRI